MKNYLRLPAVFEASDPAIAAGVEAAYADADTEVMQRHADRYADAGYGVLAEYLRDAARARNGG